MSDKKNATFHPGSTPDHPLPMRTPMEALAAHGQPPPDDPPVDRMHYDSPGPAPWATKEELAGARRPVPVLAWVALVLGSLALLAGSLAVIALTDRTGTVPAVTTVVDRQVTTFGKCEKRIIGEYGLVATVTAVNQTGKTQTGQIWIMWPITGEHAQRFVKPVTLEPGEGADFPVNQDIPAERWYRTGLCSYGWEPAVKANGMAPAGYSIDWGTPRVTSPSKRVIEVVDKISPKAWRVSAAVNWLDRYTASDMRLVKKCSGKAYRCITVRAGKVNGPVGWSQDSTVTIDTGKAKGGKYNRWYRYDKNRTWLLAHELGHQFGLDHSGSRNVMNEYVNRYTMTITSGQRRHLAKR